MLIVNGRFLTQPVTGVQRYATEITRRLPSRLPELQVVRPHDVIEDATARELGAVVVGRRTGHAWEQLDLPRHARRQGSPLLLNLGNTAPVRYRNAVSVVHDISVVRHPESYARSFVAAYRALLPLVVRRSRAVVTVSEFSRREIVEHYGVPAERVHVVPNAVSASLLDPGTACPAPERPYVLAVGSPAPHKNLATLLSGFERLSTDLDVELLVVGHAGRSFRQVEHAASERVRFLGRVTDAQLSALMAGATAFAFPSLYEGFGLPPLEAQAHGCPVIASWASAMPEVLGDSALLVDPHDPDALRDGLARVLSDAHLRADLAERGRRNVARFSWDASAAALADVLTELI